MTMGGFHVDGGGGHEHPLVWSGACRSGLGERREMSRAGERDGINLDGHFQMAWVKWAALGTTQKKNLF